MRPTEYTLVWIAARVNHVRPKMVIRVISDKKRTSLKEKAGNNDVFDLVINIKKPLLSSKGHGFIFVAKAHHGLGGLCSCLFGAGLCTQLTMYNPFSVIILIIPFFLVRGFSPSGSASLESSMSSLIAKARHTRQDALFILTLNQGSSVARPNPTTRSNACNASETAAASSAANAQSTF